MKIEDCKNWGPSGEHRVCHERAAMLINKPKYDEYTESQKDALYAELFRSEVLHLQRMKRRAGRT
jgi:hypothetical protein